MIKKIDEKNFVHIYLYVLVFLLCTIGLLIYENERVKVKVMGVTFAKTGNASVLKEPTYFKTKLNFKTKINDTDDKVMYLVTLKNRGKDDVIVTDISISSNSVSYNVEGIAIGNVIKKSSSHVFAIFGNYLNGKSNVTSDLKVNVKFSKKNRSNVKETNVQSISHVIAFDKDFKVVSDGSGLYQDTYEIGKFIFKGSNPNNYITFNDENWRVLAIESDGTLKIVKEEAIAKKAWDEPLNRNKEKDTYCTYAKGFGCNAWAMTKNMTNQYGKKVNKYTLSYKDGNKIDKKSSSGKVITNDSSLNVYLNNTYYNSLGSDKKYITVHDFNVGTPGDASDTEGILFNIDEEKSYMWKGNVGLITTTEYMRATTDTLCNALSYGNSSHCGNNNWLNHSDWYWTISPCSNQYNSTVWTIDSIGALLDAHVFLSEGLVYPTVYLNSDIKLSGSGSESNRFYIKK